MDDRVKSGQFMDHLAHAAEGLKKTYQHRGSIHIAIWDVNLLLLAGILSLPGPTTSGERTWCLYLGGHEEEPVESIF